MQTSNTLAIDKPEDLLPYDLVLTPNQRLSAQLSAEFDLSQTRQNRPSWRSLPISSVSNWLHNQWDDAIAAGLAPCASLRVLAADEEIELWRQSVSACYGGVLLARESAAQQVMQAWHSLKNWQINLDGATRSKFAFFEDHQFFLDCADKFERLCTQQRAIAPVTIASVLAELPAQQRGRILLYEFDELIPSQQGLLDAWQLQCDRGVGVLGGCLKESSGNSGHAPAVPAFQFSSKHSELREAALWARRTVDADEQANVAIIVPDLNSQRTLVEDVFSQVFAPGYELPQSRRGPLAFNISAGESLASQALPEHALRMLELNVRPMDIESLPKLLYSPFLSAVCADTNNARAELEYRLRNYRSQRVSVNTILHEASMQISADKGAAQRCPNLAKTLSQFRHIIAAESALTAQGWLSVFEQQLQCCGWPGTRTLDSIEFQQQQHWQQLLIDCGRLANIRFGLEQKISAHQCFDLLSQCSREYVFQAKSAACRVQVLGLLEGAGMLFTHTWISNMGGQHWPTPARPSPYIPVELQRQHRTPHCDAERELQFSGRLFASFRSHCSELVMSFVDKDGDAAAPASPFLMANASEIQKIDPVLDSKRSSEFKESYELEQTLALADEEHLAPAASIYEDQAACGFKAFARHRLRIRPPEYSALGLDGRDRGILLHDSMEAVWRELGSSAVLQATSATVLASIVSKAIDSAMFAAAKRLRYRDAAAFLKLERERLQELIMQWLELEASRDDFAVVDFEVALHTQIAQREATLRIDRVDRKRDGRLLLLEYKTGKISEASLLSEPPQAPQLPLYLSAFKGSYSAGGVQQFNSEVPAQRATGAVLCRIDAREPVWLGFGDGSEPTLLEDVKQSSKNVPEWHTLKDQWQQGLNALDAAFVGGNIQADPVHPTQTCRICDYAAVCRFAFDGVPKEPS